MPRSPSKRGQRVKEDAAASESVTKSVHKIAFVRDSLLSSANTEVVRLRNPHTDSGSMYVVDKDKKAVHEIMAFDEGFRCWFIGQTVESHGKLHMISPVDVTYLILPYLMKASRIVPLEHLLEDEEFPDLSCLDCVASDKDFSHVADNKGTSDLRAWKYNEQSTLEWLSGRVYRLSSLLQEKKVPTSTAQSLTYICPMNPEQAKEAYTVLAHGIISEYIPPELATKLHKHLKLPEKSVKPKVLGSAENQGAKKQRLEGPTDDYSKDNMAGVKGKAAMTAKEKALAKSAVGSKSILSFFGKK
ncbi:ribonuclease H2 subunit B-like isoform X1 [Scylla paramamosain]|uniref:ribonuclease H2 subunit B-like isoform X1 n=2 Tax=Scylla paramamosain TaxID=85552 RepID=UPI003083D340